MNFLASNGKKNPKITQKLKFRPRKSKMLASLNFGVVMGAGINISLFLLSVCPSVAPSHTPLPNHCQRTCWCVCLNAEKLIVIMVVTHRHAAVSISSGNKQKLRGTAAFYFYSLFPLRSYWLKEDQLCTEVPHFAPFFSLPRCHADVMECVTLSPEHTAHALTWFPRQPKTTAVSSFGVSQDVFSEGPHAFLENTGALSDAEWRLLVPCRLRWTTIAFLCFCLFLTRTSESGFLTLWRTTTKMKRSEVYGSVPFINTSKGYISAAAARGMNTEQFSFRNLFQTTDKCQPSLASFPNLQQKWWFTLSKWSSLIQTVISKPEWMCECSGDKLNLHGDMQIWLLSLNLDLVQTKVLSESVKGRNLLLLT